MIVKKRLAVIASRFPYPLNKGDKLRLFYQIKYLSKHFDIYLFAINEEHINYNEQTVVRDLCKKVTLFNLNFFQKSVGIIGSLIKSEPLQVGYFYSKKIERSITKSFKEQKIDIVYCQLSRTAVYGRAFNGPVAFDYQDCFSKNYERAYRHSKGLRKIFYKREWKSMLHYERRINQDFLAKTIISEFDKESLPFNTSGIHVIPNGVDQTLYKEQNVQKEFDILFSGNLNYQPNVDAALLIIEKLYPILKAKRPNIKIGLAGNTSNKTILASGNANIFVINHVADMRAVYAKTKIYIAPLFTGAGLQNKLLEAMSMKIPCIATHVSNLSLRATPDQEIIEVQNIEQLATSVLELLNQPAKQLSIAEKGQYFVHEHYSWDKANDQLRQVIEELL